jgi:hypothetical protein
MSLQDRLYDRNSSNKLDTSMKQNVKSRLIPHKDMNRSLEDNQPYFKNDRRSINPAHMKKAIVSHNYSYQNLKTGEQDSTSLSGLSKKDEWTEIELYNGILSKMRKDHEVKMKRDKIQEIRDTLKNQISEQKEYKKKDLEEKFKFDKMVEKTVQNDKREKDRIRLARQRKITDEKNLRDEQLFLEHKKKAMFADEKRAYESSLVSKLQKEIKEEKQTAIQKRLNELTECRKMITENEQAKAGVLEKRKKEKEEDAAALERYEKHLETQDKKRLEENKKREIRMQARMDKMKETVIDKLGKKEKQEELRMLKEVQARENKEELKEKSEKIKLFHEQMHLREFLAQQVQEKKQTKNLEREKNSMFIEQVLKKDEIERSEEKDKSDKRKQMEELNHKFLESQMQQRSSKAFGMSGEEFLINKKLLKEISDIKKKLKNKDKNVFDDKALKPF